MENNQQQNVPEPVNPPPAVPRSTFPADELRPVQPVQPVSLPPQPPKKSRKKLLAIILIVIGVLLIGGSAAAYKFWYQNPDKVIGDSMYKVLTAESSHTDGTIKAENEDMLLTLKVDAQGKQIEGDMTADVSLKFKTGEMADQTLSVKTYAAVHESGDVYAKIENLQKSLDTIVDLYIEEELADSADAGVTPSKEEIDAAKKQVASMYSPMIKKIDNQWIKLPADYINSQEDSYKKTQACLKTISEKIRSDSKMRSELADAYKNNRFIEVKEELGVQDGNLRYLLEFNQDTAKAFAAAFEGTQLHKDIDGCIDIKETTDEITSTVEDDAEPVRIELWVDRFSHEMTRLMMVTEPKKKADPTVTFDMNFRFNQDYQLSVPSDAKTVEELMKEFETESGLVDMTS